MNNAKATYRKRSSGGDESKPFGGQFLRTADVCRLTGYSQSWISELGASGAFPPPQHVIGRIKFFAREDVEFFMRTYGRARPNSKTSVRMARASEGAR